MSVLHVWAVAIGAAALGLPLIVHWLTRPRPRTMPLSTLRFVREAVQQRRARHRLRDFIILALRMLAVGALALAFARPAMGRKPLVQANDAADATRVVLLDCSASMMAADHGIQLFERARPVVAGYLNYRVGLRANLVLCGARPRAVFENCMTNFSALREALGQATPGPERLDVKAALTMATEMLAKAPAKARRELVIVSDFQRSNWAGVDFSALPADAVIQLESVAPAEAPANLAVLRVGGTDGGRVGGAATLQVEIGNFSNTPRQVNAEASVRDATLRMEGLCPARGTVTLTSECPLRSAGWLTGRVRLLGVDDALAFDNERPFVLHVRPPTTFALVTREPAELQPLSSYFLERALVPQAGRKMRRTSSAPVGDASSQPVRTEEKVVRIEPAKLDRASIGPADVIVLDRPGRLSRESVLLLVSAVQRGKALIYAASEAADAGNLKLITDVAGASMHMPIEFVPPAGGHGMLARAALRLTDVREKEPPFSVFGDGVGAIVAQLRFAGGLASRNLNGGIMDDVLARLSDGSAFLVATNCGAGVLAVLNTDLAASNLPSSGAFVPLVGELVSVVRGHRAARGADSAAPCGATLAQYLPAEVGAAAGLRVLADNGDAAELGELREDGTGVLWSWRAAGKPGTYSVVSTVGSADQRVFAVATAVPAAESDLRSMLASELQARARGGASPRQVEYEEAGGTSEAKDRAWTWFAIACAACMMAELIALKALRT